MPISVEFDSETVSKYCKGKTIILCKLSQKVVDKINSGKGVSRWIHALEHYQDLGGDLNKVELHPNFAPDIEARTMNIHRFIEGK